MEVKASVGAVLSQYQGEPPWLHTCAYFFRKLFTAERKYYVIGNRELLAIKLALEEWRHWLEGAQHPFTFITDHKNLEYLRSAKRLNPRQARWALFFTRFQFSIMYRPGDKNVKRISSCVFMPPTNPLHLNPYSLQPSLWAPSDGPWMKRSASTPSPNPLRWEAQKAKPMCPPPWGLPFWAPSMLPRALDTQAASVLSRSSKLSTGGPVWPGMSPSMFVDAQTVPSPKFHITYPSENESHYPFHVAPWSHVGVDFITDLPMSEGYTCILVAVDRFSKACKLIPLWGLPTALETADSAHVQLQQTVWGHKTYADACRSSTPVYHPGDKVWLSTSDLRLRLPYPSGISDWLGGI